MCSPSRGERDPPNPVPASVFARRCGPFGDVDAHFCPGEVGFCPGKPEFCPRENEFCPGKVQFPPGKVQFCPGKVEVRPGKVQVCPGKNGFPPGKSLFRLVENGGVSSDRPRLRVGIATYRPGAGVLVGRVVLTGIGMRARRLSGGLWCGWSDFRLRLRRGGLHFCGLMRGSWMTGASDPGLLPRPSESKARMPWPSGAPILN